MVTGRCRARGQLRLQSALSVFNQGVGQYATKHCLRSSVQKAGRLTSVSYVLL